MKNTFQQKTTEKTKKNKQQLRENNNSWPERPEQSNTNTAPQEQ
jgi:hypothetical protein